MPRGHRNLKISDSEVNRRFEINHGQGERDYYRTEERSGTRSTLDRDCFPGYRVARARQANGVE
jgi:hypothetical protein